MPAEDAQDSTFAIGLILFEVTYFSEAKAKKLAPSFNEEAFPAVTVPDFLKTAFNWLNFGKVVSFRTSSLKGVFVNSFLK